ncbi:MAG: hypothetical protein U0414_39935 [Polyangiaceae bacterium]
MVLDDPSKYGDPMVKPLAGARLVRDEQRELDEAVLDQGLVEDVAGAERDLGGRIEELTLDPVVRHEVHRQLVEHRALFLGAEGRIEALEEPLDLAVLALDQVGGFHEMGLRKTRASAVERWSAAEPRAAARRRSG